MGNTCKPMAVSFQCMTKSTTNKKKKKKQCQERPLDLKVYQIQNKNHHARFNNWLPNAKHS